MDFRKPFSKDFRKPFVGESIVSLIPKPYDEFDPGTRDMERRRMTKFSSECRTCQYCKGTCEAGTLKCRNCGAPMISEEDATFDARSCPYCRRRLLALASPACNHCGLKLPEHFLRKREEHLRRITQMTDASRRGETKDKIDEVLRIAERQDRKRSGSVLDLVNWAELTDLFS
jgi:hypothetical protein